MNIFLIVFCSKFDIHVTLIQNPAYQAISKISLHGVIMQHMNWEETLVPVMWFWHCSFILVRQAKGPGGPICVLLARKKVQSEKIIKNRAKHLGFEEPMTHQLK